MSAVENPVRGWLRLEAFVVFVAATLVWIALSGGWAKYALGFLLPDVAFVAYLFGPRAGSWIYNFAHSYALPAILAIVGGMLDHTTLLLASSLWMAHIGFDRVLGFGLKYPTSFADTHLGRLRARATFPTDTISDSLTDSLNDLRGSTQSTSRSQIGSPTASS